MKGLFNSEEDCRLDGDEDGAFRGGGNGGGYGAGDSHRDLKLACFERGNGHERVLSCSADASTITSEFFWWAEKLSRMFFDAVMRVMLISRLWAHLLDDKIRQGEDSVDRDDCRLLKG